MQARPAKAVAERLSSLEWAVIASRLSSATRFLGEHRLRPRGKCIVPKQAESKFLVSNQDDFDAIASLYRLTISLDSSVFL
jgi:hypothetical protein